MDTPQQQVSLTPIEPSEVGHDRFEHTAGLSESSKAGFSSSGHEVHFDKARLIYTPNSLKYLQVCECMLILPCFQTC